MTLYCPTCKEKLKKVKSIDKFIIKYECINQHRYFITQKEVYSSESEKVQFMKGFNYHNDDQSILEWLTKLKYRKYLNNQLATILRRIYEIKNHGINIKNPKIIYKYCPFCKGNLEFFDQSDCWVIGLKCSSEHQFLNRNGIRSGDFKLCDDMSNSSLISLINSWLKSNKSLETNINEQIKDIFKNYKTYCKNIK